MMAFPSDARSFHDLELPRLFRLRDNLFGASFHLMKLLPARMILDRAETAGLISEGCTICETTSGTFGLALAMLARVRGYRLILVSDPAIDRHLHRRLEELGTVVEIIANPAEVGGFQRARLDRLHACCSPPIRDCVRQGGVNWEAVISTVGQVVVSAARAASSLAAMPAIVSKVK